MDSRRSQVRWVLAGLALVVTVLLASCSAPPPVKKTLQPTSPTKASPQRPDRATEPARSATRTAEKQEPVVTTAEPAPSAPEVTKAPRPKRLAGYPGEVSHVSSQTLIALTFDAGASPAPTPSILKTLRDNGLHVTFFLTGKWCEKNSDLVKQIVAEGHEIGNHSHSHRDFRKLSDTTIAEELRKTEDLVMKLTGATTKPLFRPPYGGRDKRVLGTVGQEGYTSVYWSLDSWDAFKQNITSAEIQKRILDRIQGGDIVLMHCGSAATATALPDLIDELQKRGYQIVKVSEMMSGG